MRTSGALSFAIFTYAITSSFGQYYPDHLSYNDTELQASQNDTDFTDDVLSRERRTLVYPSPSNLLVINWFPFVISLDFSEPIVIMLRFFHSWVDFKFFLQLIFGLGTPLQLDRESVIVGAFTKMIYALPDNSTYFTEPGVYYGRSTKSRWSIYKVLEATGEVLGYGGKGCLLRAICEAANVPFNANHGLFGELVHAFLT